jgi:hypothetical protein
MYKEVTALPVVSIDRVTEFRVAAAAAAAASTDL